MKYKHIAVPVDFSNGSRRAMEKALELMQFYNANITVLTVVEPLPVVAYGYMGSAVMEEDMIKQAKEKLQEWGTEYKLAESQLRVEVGYPKSEIVKIAEQIHADLIVIGSHGHHGWIEHLLGSTSNAVSHRAKCDVLIVHKAPAAG